MRENSGHKLVARHCAQQLNEKGTVSMREAAEACGYAEEHSHEIAKASSFRKYFFEEVDVEFVVGMQKLMFNAARFKILNFGVGHEKEELKKVLIDNGMKVLTMEGDAIRGYKTLYAEPMYEHVEKALDTYYKLTGEYAPEKHQMVRPLDDLSDEELEQMTVGLESQQPQAKVSVIDSK